MRFEAVLPPRFCAHCHCPNCRRAHGAAFVTWAGFPDAAFRVVSGKDRLASFRTETGATRSFCRRCGTPLLYAGPRWPGEVHVARASLEGDPGLAPSAHVYVDHAAGWLPVPRDLPHFGGATGTEPKG